MCIGRAVAPSGWRPRSARPCTTCSYGMGRMLTTMLPDILPAGSHAMFVIYMLTLRPCVLWRISMPASMSSLSKLNEQPMRNADQVVAPQIFDARGVVDHHAVAVDAIAREVVGDVAVGRCWYAKKRSPTSETSKMGQGLGLRMREQQEIVGVCSLRQHDEVALRVAWAQAARGIAEASFANDMAHFAWGDVCGNVGNAELFLCHGASSRIFLPLCRGGARHFIRRGRVLYAARGARSKPHVARIASICSCGSFRGRARCFLRLFHRRHGGLARVVRSARCQGISSVSLPRALARTLR